MNKKQLQNKIKILGLKKGDFYGGCLKNFPKTVNDDTLINDYMIIVLNKIAKNDERTEGEMKHFYNYGNSKIKSNFYKTNLTKNNQQKTKISVFGENYDANEVNLLEDKSTKAEQIAYNPQPDHSKITDSMLDEITSEIYDRRVREVAVLCGEGHTGKQIQEKGLKTTRDDFQDIRQRLLYKLAKYQIEHKGNLELTPFGKLKLFKLELIKQLREKTNE